MKYTLLIILLLPVLISRSQTSKQQRKIDEKIMELEKKGAFKIDSFAIDGTKLDTLASFPGGGDAWKKVLTNDDDAFKMLQEAQSKGIDDGKYKLWIEFIVHEDGTLSKFRAITKFGYGLEPSLIALVKKYGKWLPASANGQKKASVMKIFSNVIMSTASL